MNQTPYQNPEYKISTHDQIFLLSCNHQKIETLKGLNFEMSVSFAVISSFLEKFGISNLTFK